MTCIIQKRLYIYYRVKRKYYKIKKIIILIMKNAFVRV